MGIRSVLRPWPDKASDETSEQEDQASRSKILRGEWKESKTTDGGWRPERLESLGRAGDHQESIRDSAEGMLGPVHRQEWV